MLQGKRALVTGGGTGIGAAIATALDAAGAAVTVSGRRREPLEAVAADLRNAQVIQADVTDADSVRALFAQAAPPDIVIANAGAAESASAERTDDALWSRMIAVNLTGAFLTAREALGGMRERGWGRIVFISSTAGLKGYAYVSAYCAAKHGVVGLTRSLAAETARHGITVNAVCPGYTDTPLLDRSVQRIVDQTARSAEQARATLTSNNPMQRLITPAEVAATVVWLCADSAAATTGQAIAVAGGEL